jgi:hypothetical protein
MPSHIQHERSSLANLYERVEKLVQFMKGHFMLMSVRNPFVSTEVCEDRKECNVRNIYIYIFTKNYYVFILKHFNIPLHHQ